MKPNTNPDLFDILGIAGDIHHTIGDIRDMDTLEKAYKEANPDVVLHLAAQPMYFDYMRNTVLRSVMKWRHCFKMWYFRKVLMLEDL